MKEYDVKITETLEKTVTVQAESHDAAEEQVRAAYYNSEYILDSENFTGVAFGTTEEREVQKEQADTMNVLLVKPFMYPQAVQIGCELEDLQKAVGGDIEATYPFNEPVALVMHDEGKLVGKDLNRALRDDDGDIYDIIAGDFLVVGLGEDDFCSLSPELMKQFEEHFHQPETFVRMGRSIMALPLPDDNRAENCTIVIRQGKRHNAAPHAYKSLRLMKVFLKLLHQFRGQRTKIILAQSDNQEITGDNVINIAVIITQRTVQVFAYELTFIVHDQCNRLIERISCLNIATYGFLQILQLTADLHSLRIHERLYQQHIHGTCLFFLNLPFLGRAELNTGKVFGVQNVLRIVISGSNLFLCRIVRFCLHRNRFLQGFGNLHIVFFQVSIPPFLWK